MKNKNKRIFLERMQALTEHDSLVCKRTIRVDGLNRTLDWAVKCCGKNSFHDEYYEVLGKFSINWVPTNNASEQGVAGGHYLYFLLMMNDEI